MTNLANSEYLDSNHDVRQVLRRVAFPLLVTYAFILLSFLIPIVDSTRAPFFDLNSTLALWVYGITKTGGPRGASLLAIIVVTFLVTRTGVPAKRRLIEAGVIAGFAMLFAGGGAAFNEYVIKHRFEVPRPNIVYLAGTDGSGPLGMTPSEFYALPSKQARQQTLRAALEVVPPPVSLHSLIRDHWIATTGYSFPSGHSFSAMFFATFFLALGLAKLGMPRLLFCYLLLPWSVCVCYSRAMLRVHTPTDISVGGLEGILLGVLAFVLAQVSLGLIDKK